MRASWLASATAATFAPRLVAGQSPAESGRLALGMAQYGACPGMRGRRGPRLVIPISAVCPIAVLPWREPEAAHLPGRCRIATRPRRPALWRSAGDAGQRSSVARRL